MSYRTQFAEIDLGNLLVEDKCPLNDYTEGTTIDEDCLRSISLECTRHFFKSFFELPTEKSDSITVSLLPKPTFRLPREKKIPTTKELTKWDRFARLKGIQNRKKSRKVWDPVSQSWKPRWGKDRIDDLKDKWVLEVPDNADPYEDQFAKLSQAKKERRAKNELQRLRNIARTVKEGQAPPIGVLTESQSSKTELSRAFSIAQSSDASMGRFTTPVDSRKLSKNVEKRSKKRMPLSQVSKNIKKNKLKTSKKSKV
uniref:Ribosome biogenesis regulatory protein n=1 Tax=Trichobilharzia regenti TaxID=157069 RepID=A0AA85JJW5_TRIRE